MADEWADFRLSEPERPPPADDWAAFRTAPSPEQQLPTDDWAAFRGKPPEAERLPERPPEPQPEAEGPFGTVVRKVAHNVLPTLAAIGTGVVTSPAGPWVSVPSAIAAFAGTSAAQEESLKLLGFGDEHQMAVNEKTNPKSAIAGDVLSAAVPFGVGPKLALGQRLLGAGIGTGLEGVGQLRQGEFDPTRLAVAAGTGAIFNQPRAGTAALERAVGAQAGRITGRPELWQPKVEPHGPASSPADSGVSHEPLPPSSDAAVGDAHQERGVGSEINYPNPTDAKPPIAGGGVVIGPDPAIQAVMDAARPPGAAAQRPPAPGTEAAAQRPPAPELPTEYGARLNQEFPRIPNAEAQARPLETVAEQRQERPLTPRETIEGRAPGVPAGDVLREMAARRRDQDVIRGPPLETSPEVDARVRDALAREGPARPQIEPLPASEAPLQPAGEAGLPRRSEAEAGPPAPLSMDEHLARATSSYAKDEPFSGMGPKYFQSRARTGADGKPEFYLLGGDRIIDTYPSAKEANTALKEAKVAQKAYKAGEPVPAEGGGAPPIPPDVGTAARAGAGGTGRPPGAPPPGDLPPGAGEPNLAHTPPQQRSALNELWRDIQRKTAAHTLGPEGMEARRLIRGSYGETQRVAEQTADLLNKHQETIRAMPDADRWAMINQMQGGDRFPDFHPTPEQRTFMNNFERSMQEWEGKLHQLDATDQMNFRKNFMAQMYENPQAAPDMAFSGLGKRGSAGSTRARKYDTYEDAKAAGLTPLTSDPIEIGTRYANSIKNFVASRDVLQRGEAGGSVGYFKPPQAVGATGSPEPLIKGGPPPGWKPLNGVPDKNGRTAYAPADFADTFNNFYDKGMAKGEAGKNIYETLRNSSNAWTQLELGINGYHFFTMANEAIISDAAKGLSKVLSGDIRGGLKDIAKAPLAPIPGQRAGEALEKHLGITTRYMEGKRFQQEYLDPNSTNPIATILAEANARPVGRGHAADYTLQDRGSFVNKFSPNNLQSEFKQAWKEIQGDYAAAGSLGERAMFPIRQAGRALQTVAAPLFDKYIPVLKAGAVHSQMKDWHEAMIRKDPNFDMINNPADRRTAVNAAMKIVDSVDNRFGQMNSDNMFMNATLKQSAQVAMRSFSWAIGSMKEIGGGTYATGKALGALARGENRFSMTHPEWDPRMSYAIAFPFVVATVSSIYQFLRDGEAPTGWRDLYAPRTGGTVPGVGGRGQVPEHVLMPGYQKDVLGWIHDPVREAYNKLGGLPTTAIEQATGKDWRGDAIVKPGSSAIEAAGQRMAYILGKLSPISIKNMVKGTESTSRITRAETALGFHAPGAYIQDPQGLERALDAKAKREWQYQQKRQRKTELRQAGG